jgi:hypothetical protein
MFKIKGEDDGVFGGCVLLGYFLGFLIRGISRGVASFPSSCDFVG